MSHLTRKTKRIAQQKRVNRRNALKGFPVLTDEELIQWYHRAKKLLPKITNNRGLAADFKSLLRALEIKHNIPNEDC